MDKIIKSAESNGRGLKESDSIIDHEFLSFILDNEEYAVDILKVKEIRRYESVTRIANAPDFVKGVINLRGVIVPVLDMRIKLNLDAREYDEFTLIIVLNIADRIIGVIVDGVSDVMTMRADQIKLPSSMSEDAGIDYLMGIGDLGDRLLMLIDIEKLLSTNYITEIKPGTHN